MSILWRTSKCLFINQPVYNYSYSWYLIHTDWKYLGNKSNANSAWSIITVWMMVLPLSIWQYLWRVPSVTTSRHLCFIASHYHSFSWVSNNFPCRMLKPAEPRLMMSLCIRCMYIYVYTDRQLSWWQLNCNRCLLLLIQRHNKLVSNWNLKQVCLASWWQTPIRALLYWPLGTKYPCFLPFFRNMHIMQALQGQRLPWLDHMV